MTKVNKTFLMTLLSLALIVCTALGIVLSTPASAKADTPDYLSWDRTEAKAGDLLANRYVLFDKAINTGTFLQFDVVGDVDYPDDYGEIRFAKVEDKGYELFSYSNEDDSSVIWMNEYYEDNNYAVYYITPFITNYGEGVIGTLPLTLTSTLSYDVDGMYFITDNGATLPEDSNQGTETPEEGALKEFSGVNYNAVYLKTGDTIDNTAYLCVPVDKEGVITLVSQPEGSSIFKNKVDDVQISCHLTSLSKTINLDPVAYTNRYGVKTYVYDVSSLPVGLVVKGFFGDGPSFYMLTLKDGAEPETPGTTTPGNGGNTEDPGDGGNPGTETPEYGDFWDKAREFFSNISEYINRNTGVVVGSTGALILVAVVLYLIFRK